MTRKICKFKTRKFYDYKDHNYVTLEHIANCVNKGEDLQIQDELGNDITNITFLKALEKRAEKIDALKLINLIKEDYYGS